MKDKVITPAPNSPLNKMLDLITNVASRKIPVVAVFSELHQAYAKIREEIHQDRMLDFALDLRDSGIDKDNFDLSPECFSAIVTKLLLDDEKRKTEFYIVSANDIRQLLNRVGIIRNDLRPRSWTTLCCLT